MLLWLDQFNEIFILVKLENIRYNMYAWEAGSSKYANFASFYALAMHSQDPLVFWSLTLVSQVPRPSCVQPSELGNLTNTSMCAVLCFYGGSVTHL